MKVRPSMYFVIFLMIVSVVFIVYSLTFGPLQAKIVALIIGPLIIILGILQIRKEIQESGYETNKEEQTAPRQGSGSSLRKYGIIAAWLIGYFATTYLMGFYISIPLFIASYLKLNGSRWQVAIGVAALVTALAYVSLEFSLKRFLWLGIFFE